MPHEINLTTFMSALFPTNLGQTISRPNIVKLNLILSLGSTFDYISLLGVACF